MSKILSKADASDTRRLKHQQQRNENIIGYVFVTPALLAFLMFIAFPFFFSLFLSLTEWNFLSGIQNLKFVGLENFRELLRDRRFGKAFFNTFTYALATVPTSILIALVLAYLLNGKVYGKKLLRLFFFIPYISSAVALSAVFKFMFREDGIINNILMSLHIVTSPVKWFTNPQLNKVPIVLLLIWTAIGYELIIYMAALQNIPKSLLEASELDGATGFRQFVHITFPLISPTTFYLVIVRLISAFKVFSAIDVMTLGSKALDNTSMVVQIYDEAFTKYNFGYASAEAVVLFAVILIITLINFWGQKKWVHY